MRKQLENATSDDEKKRMLGQLDQFEDAIAAQMKIASDQQSSRLQAALAARRAKKQKLKGIISDEKHQKVLDDFKRRTGNAVNENVNEDNTVKLAGRIQTQFDGGEQVQVSENLLDKRNKQELIDLMNSLFQERANALRKFMYELMMQKQRELDDLKEEYEPQRQLLQQRKEAKLISDEDYAQQLERIN